MNHEIDITVSEGGDSRCTADPLQREPTLGDASSAALIACGIDGGAR